MSDVNEQLDRIREVIEDIETKGYSELQIGGKRFKAMTFLCYMHANKR